MMQLVVTGYRRGNADVSYWLDRFLDRWGRPSALFVGDAGGVDAQAHSWAHVNNIETRRFRAYWSDLGDAAGPRRNQKMVDAVNEPDSWCLGFPGPDSRGTFDCMDKARAAGLRVVALPYVPASRSMQMASELVRRRLNGEAR